MTMPPPSAATLLVPDNIVLHMIFCHWRGFRYVLAGLFFIFAAGPLLAHGSYAATVAIGACAPLLLVHAVPWTVTRQQKLAILQAVAVPPLVLISTVSLFGSFIDSLGAIYELTGGDTIFNVWFLIVWIAALMMLHFCLQWASFLMVGTFSGPAKFDDDWANTATRLLAPIPFLRKIEPPVMRILSSALPVIFITVMQNVAVFRWLNPIMDVNTPGWQTVCWFLFCTTISVSFTLVLAFITNDSNISSGSTAAERLEQFMGPALMFPFKFAVLSCISMTPGFERPDALPKDEIRLAGFQKILADRRAGLFDVYPTSTGYSFYTVLVLLYFADLMVWFLLISGGRTRMGRDFFVLYREDEQERKLKEAGATDGKAGIDLMAEFELL
ncbi:hypothetical protein MKEN_01150000 [Mycena kentingensis (nom. inval.)]|nr:hypothetical protein MKEN_01150000 [Mycena kentingensis (nom. inval.)]